MAGGLNSAPLENFPFYRRNTFKRQRSYLKTERMR